MRPDIQLPALWVWEENRQVEMAAAQARRQEFSREVQREYVRQALFPSYASSEPDAIIRAINNLPKVQAYELRDREWLEWARNAVVG